MSRVGCVMVWLGVLCVGVASVARVYGVDDVGVQMKGGVKTTSLTATHVNSQPLNSCRGLSGLMHLLKRALDDLHALQKMPNTQGRHLRKIGRRKAKVRARQWARKLQRRLLRLCPRQVGSCFRVRDGRRREVDRIVEQEFFLLLLMTFFLSSLFRWKVTFLLCL